jgi:hypothetical protein
MFVSPVNPSPAEKTAPPPAAESSERNSFFEYLDRVREDRQFDARPERADTTRPNEHANDRANDRADNRHKTSHDARADEPGARRETPSTERNDHASNNPNSDITAAGQPAHSEDATETPPATDTNPDAAVSENNQDTILNTKSEVTEAQLATVPVVTGETVPPETPGTVPANSGSDAIGPASISGEPELNDGSDNAMAGKDGIDTPNLSVVESDTPAIDTTPETKTADTTPETKTADTTPETKTADTTPETKTAVAAETQSSIALATIAASDTVPATTANAAQNTAAAATIGADTAARRETLRPGAATPASPAIPATPATDVSLDGKAAFSDTETARLNPNAKDANPNAAGNADKGGEGTKAGSVMAASGPSAQDQARAPQMTGTQPTVTPTESLKAAASDALPAAESLARSAPEARSGTQGPTSVQSPAAVSAANDLRLASNASPLAETAAGRNAPGTATQQVAFQISRAVSQDNDRFTLDLKPATLGRISVTLEVGHDNRVIAVIQAERPETLELLQRDQRALERALQEAGLKTDSGSLSFSLQGDGGEETAADDQNSQTGTVSVSMEDQEIDDNTASQVLARSLDGTGLDINV